MTGRPRLPGTIDTLFLQWAWNTLWIAVVSTALSLFAGVFGGYALSRLMFPGSTVFSIWIFITCLVPPALLFIPLTGVTGELILGDVFFWGPLMAGALFGSVPVAIVYSFFVEHYVSGMTGAVKG